MTRILSYPRRAGLTKAFGLAMRLLRLCPHANVGWPIRCGGERLPSQHCCDCGAQRTYLLQPSIQRGAWTHLQPLSSLPVDIAYKSNVEINEALQAHLAIS